MNEKPVLTAGILGRGAYGSGWTSVELALTSPYNLQWFDRADTSRRTPIGPFLKVYRPHRAPTPLQLDLNQTSYMTSFCLQGDDDASLAGSRRKGPVQ